jgi:hypothetical protein
VDQRLAVMQADSLEADHWIAWLETEGLGFLSCRIALTDSEHPVDNVVPQRGHEFGDALEPRHWPLHETTGRDESAAPVPYANLAVLLEELEGLADGRPADSEASRDLGLCGQRIARSQPVFGD